MVFYGLLTGNKQFTKTMNMLKLEMELGFQFTVSQWQKAIKWAYTASACTKHREQFQKLLTQCYYTPHRVAKAFPLASPSCWRACRETGSLLHVFWSCPSLRQFWGNILNLISTLIQSSCPKGPEFALLLIGIDTIPPPQWIVACNILHAARLTIARNWKSTDIPSLEEINAIVSEVPTWHSRDTGPPGLHGFPPLPDHFNPSPPNPLPMNPPMQVKKIPLSTSRLGCRFLFSHSLFLVILYTTYCVHNIT